MKRAHLNFGALPLVALRAFEAAARLGSFREGAAEVGLTPSAVSHHVRGLEMSLGTALFRRLHRRVELTAAGERLAAAVGAGLSTIAGAYAAERALSERLIVSAAPLFASRWLLPAVHVLAREGIELRVEAQARHADVLGGACDVAIRLSAQPPAGLAAECLLRSPVILVGAPGRLQGRPCLPPHEIAASPLLGLSARPRFWADVLRLLGHPAGAQQEVVFDSLEAALVAAEAGHGLAFAPEVIVRDRLAAGTLAILHPRRFGHRSGWSYWFLTRQESASQPSVRRLREVLMAALPHGAEVRPDAAAPRRPGRTPRRLAATE